MSRAAQGHGPPNGFRNMSNGSNPSLGGTTAAPSLSNTPANGDSQARLALMSRAERFEDEKRRIIESCFSKLDPNGQLAESYITHIRIIEDAQNPSTPPPPDSSEANKKPRLIIIAVRSTGRVRMHKARENNNGSFSIGKTWNMEELSVIESFSNSSQTPQSEKEAQYRHWAGNLGFTVTITKPYYWQAGTAKEKEFFIASAVKIYKKYTRGQVPELRGFDEAQRVAILGVPLGPSQPAMDSRVSPSGHSPAPPQPPFAVRPQSREDSRYRASPGPPASISDRGPRGPSPQGGRPPSESPGRFGPPIPKPFASTEHLRSGSRERLPPDFRPGTSPGPGGYRSPPPTGALPPPPQTISQSPHANFRTDSPVTTSVSPDRLAPPRRQSPPRTPSFTQSVQNGPDEHAAPRPPRVDGGTGGDLFHATKDRWMNQRQDPQQSTPPIDEQQQRAGSPAGAPQLPPIKTRQGSAGRQIHARTPTADSTPGTAGSEGVSDIDTATLAALTGFQGPGHSHAEPPSRPMQEPSSPPTPERSKKRPPVESETTTPNLDLRPAPLASRSKIFQEDDGKKLASSKQEAPEVQPLSLPSTQSAGSLRPAVTSTDTAQRPSPTSGSEEVHTSDERKTPGLEEDFRPGLGPMIRKKIVADRFKKAATAATAFKPRPGGAAEKILKAKAEREASGEITPDGISAVVPRPSVPAVESDQGVASRTGSDDVVVSSLEEASHARQKDVASPVPSSTRIVETDERGGVQLHDRPGPSVSPEERSSIAEQDEGDRIFVDQNRLRQVQVKVRRRSAQQERHIIALGIDPAPLRDRCLDFEMLLDDFGWKSAALSSKALAEMEAELRREQRRLEAGSWLSDPSQDSTRDDREKAVMSCIDKAIQECDEMDKLLTIYNVELSTLNDDVAYIEAQSQGLQVQAANQRLLFKELSGLLDTVSLDKRTLEPIRRAYLSDATGVHETEKSLVRLYQAMIIIDPNIRTGSSGGRPKSRGAMTDGNELGSMTALREKRDVYERESKQFCQKLLQHLDKTFATNFGQTQGRVLRPVTGNTAVMRLNTDAVADARRSLWIYSPLLLFAKELDRTAWTSMLRTYFGRAKVAYQDPFSQNVTGWKRAARIGTGDEADILFTAQDKVDQALSGSMVSARKLTVKRSATLAKTLRTASGGEKSSGGDTRNQGSLMHCEVFAGAMDEMAPLINQEQNFIVDLFHATSLEQIDFMDAVGASAPERRTGSDINEPKSVEPDRDIAELITGAMDDLFGTFKNDMNVLLDWSVQSDPIQGVGVMACLSRHAFFLQDTNQEFLVHLVEHLMTRLQSLFSKFVDEQVRAIEDTKVKISKRKGVIAFMKIFPQFSAAVENVFSAVGRHDYEVQADCMADVRKRIDGAYDRVNKAMFDSLKIIAKEGPNAGLGVAVTTTDDPQQEKEMLNHEVLIIENMNHYIEEVDDGGRDGVLAKWMGIALMDRAEALEAYVGRVIRRPLGKLLEFLDSIEALRPTHQQNPSAITNQQAYSRRSARHLLQTYSGKEVRLGIVKLRERVTKHFSGEDDENLSRALISMVLKECERAYEKTMQRMEDNIRDLYPPTEGEKPVEFDFGRADVQAAFRR